MAKHITFVIRNQVGGIAYMNHQIIAFSGLKKYFNVHIILFRAIEDDGKRFEEPFAADTIDHFEYSGKDNFFLVLKRFNALLNKYPGVVVTNDGIELKAIQKFGTQSLVYALVHDFYNLKLACRFFDMVNVFICHTETYAQALRSSGSVYTRIDFLAHGVRVGKEINNAISAGKPLQILFIGRLVATKGVLLLRAIERQFEERKLVADWTIIGSGPLEGELKKQWSGKSNIRFLAPEHNDEVMDIAREADVFISPSVFEGYGIALLEAMSCGLVPVVYHTPIGIAPLLPENAGFVIAQGNLDALVQKLIVLNNDRSLLAQMKRNAYSFVSEKYNIERTAKDYLDSFLNTEQLTVKFSRKEMELMGYLDKPFLPNRLSRFLKKSKSWIRTRR